MNCAISPSTGPGAPSRSCRARRSSSTSTACSPTRRAASTTSSRPARTGVRSSTRAARTGSSRRSRRSSICSIPTLQIVLLTARPHRIHHLTEAWLRRYEIRWDLLIMRPWGDYELARDFKELTVWELRSAGFELRLAFEDDRRNVEMFRARGHSLPLRALRLLRLIPPVSRAQTVQVVRSPADGRGAVGSPTSQWPKVDQYGSRRPARAEEIHEAWAGDQGGTGSGGRVRHVPSASTSVAPRARKTRR